MTEQEENKQILKLYKKLIREAKPYLQDGDIKQINKAFRVAAAAHSDMRRKSGEPYIFHPIEVARICVNQIGLGTTSIIAALLHDVVEDTDWKISDIRREFGDKVAKIIEGLTKIKGVFEFGTSEQAENFRKVLLTLSEDVRVILIKLCDRLHNMRTMESMNRSKQLKIASETMYLYAPLAHRLGLYEIKSELEDLYIKYTDTEQYNEIVSKLEKTKDVRERFIRLFSRPIIEKLKEQNISFQLKARTKSVYSILSKIRKQGVTFEEVYDVFAIRIILDVPFEEEKSACWYTYSIVTDYYKPNPERLRDWVSTPKSNGYESLHTTVMSSSGKWVEVQIRTKRMDDIAEKGFAAHWKYKGKGDAKKDNRDNLQLWLDEVRKSLENKDLNALEFLDEFRSNLFSEEVFVFTPEGELKTFPAGSTSLDFAYNIHTQLGNSCLGAKVNNKLVPLSYILKNGDQVEIITSPQQKPNKDWLRFVQTSKAIHKIKEAIKDDQKILAKEGREILDGVLHNLKLKYDDYSIAQLVNYFGYSNSFDLLYEIGNQSISVEEIEKAFEHQENVSKSEKLGPISDAKSFEKELKKVRGVNADMLLIGEDMDKIDYTFAPCCHPIEGDDVFGFVTMKDGIRIHRTNCPNARELMSNFGYRIVKAKWTKQHKIAFLAGLKITGSDRVGLINDVTRVISNNHKVNMRSITVDANDGMFMGRIMLYVNDTEHLEDLIKNLKSVHGVLSLDRFDYEHQDSTLF